jgi:hypothetical protein
MYKVRIISPLTENQMIRYESPCCLFLLCSGVSMSLLFDRLKVYFYFHSTKNKLKYFFEPSRWD